MNTPPEPNQITSAADRVVTTTAERQERIAIHAASILNVYGLKKLASAKRPSPLVFSLPKPVRGNGNDEARINAAVEKRLRKRAKGTA